MLLGFPSFFGPSRNSEVSVYVKKSQSRQQLWLYGCASSSSGTALPVAPCTSFPKCKTNTAQTVPAQGSCLSFVDILHRVALYSRGTLLTSLREPLADLHLFHHHPTDNIGIFV